MEFKTSIDTREFGFPERDLEVMLVLLKIFVFYNSISNEEEKRYFNFSRWNEFFNNVFPYEVKVDEDNNRSVWALSTAKKYLLDNGYIKFTKPKGKKYKLWELENSNKEKIIKALASNPKDYDADLMNDIQEYIKEYDKGKSKFKSSEDAFKSVGL